MGEQLNSSAIICCFASSATETATQRHFFCSHAVGNTAIATVIVQKMSMDVFFLTSCHLKRHHSVPGSDASQQTSRLIDFFLHCFSLSATAVERFWTITVWWSTTRPRARSALTSETWWVLDLSNGSKFVTWSGKKIWKRFVDVFPFTPRKT